MANFKVHYGTVEELQRTPLQLGYAYFTPEDGHFYIDGKIDGVVRRICINPQSDLSNLFRHYESIYEFPNVGEGNCFYVDDSTGDMFLFGIKENTYTSVGIANRDTIYGGEASNS